MFYYSDFFGKSFDIIEERYQQKKLFSTFCEVSNDFTEENIYIDSKTPLPMIFGVKKDNIKENNIEERWGESEEEWEDEEENLSDYYGEGYRDHYE
ncbi:11490_t:CDS:1, partial [Scutellospora calospora]